MIAELSKRDCLDWLPVFRGKAQLVYIDPPYNTGQTFHHKDGSIAYYDQWERSIDYQQWLALRLQECWRALSADGSLWVHTDWHCDHIVRGLLDEICGQGNYRNQIAWCYKMPRVTKRKLATNHQTIYYYAMPDAPLNNARVPYHPKTIARSKFPTYNSRMANNHNDAERGHNPDGCRMRDWWDDIAIHATDRAPHHGYPTEKPLALLERIVKLSSDEGRLVIDPMMGSGVAMEAAKRLNRQYAGCDLNPQAVQMAISRLAAIPAVQPSLGAAT